MEDTEKVSNINAFRVPNTQKPWLNSYKEVNLISTVSQWISVCLLEIRLISNGDMDGLLYGAYYGHASL